MGVRRRRRSRIAACNAAAGTVTAMDATGTREQPRPTRPRGVKPLGQKAYGSIGHLPGSRMGPADHHINHGQARICTERPRPGDLIVVQEKLDGSCVAVAKLDSEIVALIRAGYRAADGRHEFQRRFDEWVTHHSDRFDALLGEGERVVGEWLALAHGTIYRNLTSPFVAFDIMVGHHRTPSAEVARRCSAAGIEVVPTLTATNTGVPVSEALELLGDGQFHPDPADGPEGIVYRVERGGVTDFLAKWVNPNKVDGKYLPEISGADERWNWPPPVG